MPISFMVGFFSIVMLVFGLFASNIRYPTPLE